MNTTARKISLLVSAISVLGLLGVVAESSKKTPGDEGAPGTNKHVASNGYEMQWTDAPPFLPAGAKFTVLQGDPAKAGVYTIRLKMPSGYRIPPHSHPTTEDVTVIAGMMTFGMGDTFLDTGGRALSAGGFACMPAGMNHFAWATGDTVVQVHGMGPFEIKYCHPEDDPRQKK